MIKKISVAGLQLDNYSVHESMMELEKHVNDTPLYMMEEVTMDMLLMAAVDDTIKVVLSSINQTVIAENGILDAAEIKNAGRRREIENHSCFYELLKRLERNHKSVFVLGMTEKAVASMKEYIEQEFPRIIFAGVEAMEHCPGTADAIINEINAATPHTIISVFASPEQEYFLYEHKDKLSAKIWYGVGEEIIARRKVHFIRLLRDKIRVRQLISHSKERK